MRVGLLSALALLCTALFALPALAGTTERVSVSSAGEQGNAASYWGTLSADGRYVAFISYASNLVAGDTNGYLDVFVHDRLTGTTERVSVSSAREQGNADSGVYSGAEAALSLSADGRYVAFGSEASNLVPGDTNGTEDAFVHDRLTGTTERVNVRSTGEQADGGAHGPLLSADGRYAAFSSSASNLVAGDTNGITDVFVHDRVTGATKRVSVSSAGEQPNGASLLVSLSADGRYVSFVAKTADLVPGDTNGAMDVFVHDRVSGTTERVSISSAGEQGNADSYWGRLSADGRYVAFYSYATNLVPGDTNGTEDAFVHDRVTGTTERVSVSNAGEQGNAGTVLGALNADGRYVAFYSSSTNLVLGDTNGYGDAFVHDRVTGTTERVSVSSAGEQGNADSGGFGPLDISLSADGCYVAFDSYASNLVSGDTNYADDVFVHDREGTGTDPGGPILPPDPPTGTARHYLTGQLHAHWMSDEKWGVPLGADYTPAGLEYTYWEQGFDFIAPTEHHPDPKWTWLAPGMFEDPHVPGILHLGDSMEDSAAPSLGGIIPGSHILGAAFDWDSLNQSLAGTSDRQARLDTIQGAGQGLAFVAHPDAWSYRWSDRQLVDLRSHYDGIEVYNSALDMIPALWSQSRATDTWTNLLQQGADVRAIAGDDFTPNVVTALNRAAVTVVVDLPADVAPGASDIESKLREGRFYTSYVPYPYAGGASVAPQIQGWWYDAGANRARIRMYCPYGLKEVRFFTGSNPDRGTAVSVAPIAGQTNTWEASLTCTEANRWVRAEVRDWYGRRSLTQPLWLNRVEMTSAQWPPLSLGLRAAAEPGPLVLDLADAHVEVSYPQSAFTAATGELVGMADRPAAAPPLGYVGQCYRFTPAVGLQGANSLTIGYDPADVGLCREDALRIYRYDEGTAQWAALPSTVDTDAATVTASVDRLGVYALSGDFGEDVTAPAIAISSPGASALVSGQTEIEVAASDDNGVASVQFLLDGLYLGYDTTWADGWTCSLDTSVYVSGPHMITAVATDASGNQSEATVEVTVGDGLPAPGITISSPAEGAILWGEVRAAGDWLGVLPFSSGIISLGETAVALAEPVTPSGTTWAVDNDVDLRWSGPITLTVEGADSAGNRAVASSTVDFRTFSDIEPGFWARSSIYALARAGISQGYPGYFYQPDWTVTRDQLAVYIARAMNGGDPTGPATVAFTDITNPWANVYIAYCVEHGVVKGFDATHYGPSQEVDRGSMAVFVARAKGWVSIDDAMNTAPELFADVPAGYWSGTAIQACVDHGVVHGYDPTHYQPDWTVTRDQMAVFVQRAFQLPM